MIIEMEIPADAADYAGLVVLIKLEIFLNPLPVVKDEMIRW